MGNTVRYDIPEGTDPSRCRGCQAMTYWIKTPAGKNMLVEPDGTPHWATCPKADQFRNYDAEKDPKRARQLHLFSRLLEINYRLTPWEQRFIDSITQKFGDKPRQLTRGEDSALEKIHGERA